MFTTMFGAHCNSLPVSADLVLCVTSARLSYLGQFSWLTVNISTHGLGTKALVWIKAEPLVCVQLRLGSAQCLLCLESFPGVLTLPSPDPSKEHVQHLQRHSWAAKLTSTWPINQTLEGFHPRERYGHSSPECSALRVATLVLRSSAGQAWMFPTQSSTPGGRARRGRPKPAWHQSYTTPSTVHISL